jgi:hypothetical protein
VLKIGAKKWCSKLHVTQDTGLAQVTEHQRQQKPILMAATPLAALALLLLCGLSSASAAGSPRRLLLRAAAAQLGEFMGCMRCSPGNVDLDKWRVKQGVDGRVNITWTPDVLRVMPNGTLMLSAARDGVTGVPRVAWVQSEVARMKASVVGYAMTARVRFCGTPVNTGFDVLINGTRIQKLMVPRKDLSICDARVQEAGGWPPASGAWTDLSMNVHRAKAVVRMNGALMCELALSQPISDGTVIEAVFRSPSTDPSVALEVASLRVAPL